jgi:hypothetical protein
MSPGIRVDEGGFEVDFVAAFIDSDARTGGVVGFGIGVIGVGFVDSGRVLGREAIRGRR